MRRLRSTLLAPALLAAGCGGGEEAAEQAGRARFAAARAAYERDFTGAAAGSTAPMPPSAAPPASATGGASLPAAPSLATAGSPDSSIAPSSLAPAPGAGAAGTPSPAPGSSRAVASDPGRALPGATPPAAQPAIRPVPGTAAPRLDATALTGGATTGSAPDPSNPPAAATPPSAATPAPPGPTGTATPAGEPTPTPSATPRPTEPPGSDSQPPTLESLVFDPAATTDNARVTLRLVARDNKAGADRAKGAVSGPSGRAKLYFDLSPGGEDLLLGQIRVPPGAEAGEWSVLYLTISDRAFNSATYTAADSAVVQSARFRVSSTGDDADPPLLESIVASPPEARDSSNVKVFVRASDEKSNVSGVRGTFSSPSGAARLAFTAYLNKATGTFEGSMTLPPHAESGEWRVSELVITDSAKNRLTLGAGDARLREAKVKVNSQADPDPPRLLSISVAPSSVHPPGLVQVNVTASDAVSGVRSVDGTFQMGSSPSPRPFSLQRLSPGQFLANVDIPDPSALGTWRVSSLTLQDYAGNRVTLPASDPIVATAVFEVR